MKRTLLFLSMFLGLSLILTGCGEKNNPVSTNGGAKEEKKVSAEKTGGIADVCSYFPKELVESAIGKSIVKVEVPLGDAKTCFYYTLYRDNFDHTPYGDKPGGTPVVAVYDIKDFVKDKAYNETHGSKYGSDPSIGMDNYVVRNNAGKIWQTVLILGNDKYLRIHFIHDAVKGEDLVKIAKKFAEKIKSK